MSESKMLLLVLKGHISELSPEEQSAVRDACDRIKAIFSEGDMAQIGFALATAELTVEQGE